ncbi:LytTR family DNA-binding domain-containing protein [Maricaulis sp.]|uniref:LytR/AlgR family response regulator transcription factor n=1 Tax=Maricaulis sp. TaxID=1486257 RepID=UPI002B2775C9|nr:LytTR family DNA-binding domain-containing protein [Maricaulis sp.]
MAFADEIRDVRRSGFPLRAPFLAITSTTWLACLLIFTTAAWLDAVRQDPQADYTLYLLAWARGLLPWLILFPIVFKLGARDSHSNLRESAGSAVLAGITSMVAILAYAAIAFSIGTDRTPLQTLSSFGVRDFLWDVVLFAMAFLVGRQMRPPPDPQTAQTPQKGSLAVKSSGRVDYVPVAEILGATAQGNYIALHLNDRDVLHRTTMAQLVTALSGAGFVRIHRSHLVNPSCVRVARSRGESFRMVELTNGARLPVSDRYRADVRERLDQRVLG